jgi:glycosyltransferase involved in cell wall biosynthesis
MNIIFVSPQPFPHGMAGSKRIRLFAEYLAINHTVKVIVTGKNNSNNAIKGKEKNVDFEFFRFNRVQSFTALFKTRKIVKANYNKHEKNVIVIYDGIGLTNFLFALVGKKCGFKIVTDIVEDYSLHEENTGILLSILHKINSLFEKRTNKIVNGVIVISTRLRNKMKKLNIEDDKMELIPINAENINFIPQQRSVDPKHLIFIYSGSYGNKDGIEFLIHTFREFVKKNRNVTLMLSGKITDKILELIHNDSSIIYKGLIPEEEYYEFLSKADALLMTRVNSEYANTGFPFKLGEYLATGKPVIASKVSDVELYLKDREDAILINPSDPDSLMDAFNYVMNNRNEIIKIGENGKKKCLLFFNPVINGDKLEKFLLGVAKN